MRTNATHLELEIGMDAKSISVHLSGIVVQF